MGSNKINHLSSGNNFEELQCVGNEEKNAEENTFANGCMVAQ